MICWLLVLCAISLAVAVVALFLRTSGMRRDLDDVLVAAAAKEGEPGARQLGMLERWRPDGSSPEDGPVALAVPERRWTYGRDYMRAFIDAIAERPVPGKPGESWLSVYAGPILGWDMAFAVSLACFVVLAWLALAAVAPAACLGGWLPRLCLLLAAMGALYGLADVAEDLKLRRIFRIAREIRAKTGGAPPPPPGVGRNFDPEAAALAEPPGGREAPDFAPDEPEIEELYAVDPPYDAASTPPAPPAVLGIEPEQLDDAEVDAANALTRIKLVAIFLSIIGAIVFWLLSEIGKRLPRRAAAVKSS
jgi:hypothetical protein